MPADAALLDLLRLLKQRNYTFVTPTPATHARVLSRPDRQVAHTIEDVLGWSLPFQPGVMPPDLLECLATADMLEAAASGQRSRIRVSALRGKLYLHSAYPTVTQEAVFFGPDSYRFADLIARELSCEAPAADARIVDIGTGAGAGAIVAATACPDARVTMTDINARALRFARLNAAAAGARIDIIETAGLERVDGPIDIATINPPYIVDDGARTYRDGGGMHGAELSLELTTAALDRVAPGGRVILYTGSAIVGGQDALRTALAQRAASAGCSLCYRELDPDVFGEELDGPAYRDVDRIALVAATLRRGP
ncbi:methyltransferase [Sphingomonas crusticola]|uniref:methyltransferase n=1 Tax=Sphingomonas crusticola TaxID=1697973 RepID=UPI001F086725|nr:methyltransferase [Sphingomonas crusticola]